MSLVGLAREFLPLPPACDLPKHSGVREMTGRPGRACVGVTSCTSGCARGNFLKHLIVILIGLLLVGWVVMRDEPCLGEGTFWEQITAAKECVRALDTAAVKALRAR